MLTYKKIYYPYFDYVRFLAASVVMFGHNGLIHWGPIGKVAVDVFFALSGWLIGGILLRTTKQDLPRFYFNRAARIWIPYLVALSLIVIVSLLKDSITLKWFEFVLYKLTFVYNIFGPPQLAEYRNFMPLDGTGNHFWSVNAEEQFYLLAPLLLVVLSKFGRHFLLWVALSLVAWQFNLYAPIFLGVLSAILVNKYGAFHRKLNYRITWVLLIMLSIAGFIYGNDYRIFSPAFAIAIILLLAIEGKSTATGKFLGGISYPLYLNNWIGVFAANVIFAPFGLRDSIYSIMATIIISYAIASTLYQFIDKPCLSLRGSLYTATRGKTITYVAYISVTFGLLFGILVA